MENFQILAIFILLFLFEFEAIIFVSFHIIYTYKLRLILDIVLINFITIVNIWLFYLLSSVGSAWYNQRHDRV